MKEGTNLQKAVMSIEGDPRLDRYVKELFSDRQILARILKRVTTEFKDERIDDIMAAIEGEPEIETVPVNPGLTNAKGMPPEASRITGESTEKNENKDELCGMLEVLLDDKATLGSDPTKEK
nr:hypothetical protein [Clostridia bacterium]